MVMPDMIIIIWMLSHSEPEVDETIQEYCSEKDDDEPADSDED